MSRRTLVYIGIAVALVVAAKLMSSPGPRTPQEPTTPTMLFDASPPPLPKTVQTLKRPANSLAEFGVLTDKPLPDLDDLCDDRTAIANLVRGRHCGDDAACAAVRDTFLDTQATVLQAAEASDWNLSRANVDAGARGLTAAQRARIKKLPNVVVVHVATGTGARQLALRTAIAITAALAEKLDGIVWDQLLERFESPQGFAAHAITEPLGEPTFRRDRIELLYEPKQEGIVRILTSGLSRWGQPDVEAPSVPTAATDRVGEIVLGVAAAIANGAPDGPITLTRDDLAHARGKDHPADAGMPEPEKVAVDVGSAHPESGDPNDFMARIEPPAGESALAMVDLAERFFGPVLAASPGSDVMNARQKKAQAELADALAKWSAGHGSGTRLMVQMPFPIPGDAGSESMWIEVSGFNARTVTGRLQDEPLGATDVHFGDEVTRLRAEVEDLKLTAPSASAGSSASTAPATTPP
ncbi:MAG TPA: DUF2314 domain-containing protein [Polyangiaceae bacterium]